MWSNHDGNLNVCKSSVTFVKKTPYQTVVENYVFETKGKTSIGALCSKKSVLKGKKFLENNFGNFFFFSILLRTYWTNYVYQESWRKSYLRMLQRAILALTGVDQKNNSIYIVRSSWLQLRVWNMRLHSFFETNNIVHVAVGVLRKQ